MEPPEWATADQSRFLLARLHLDSLADCLTIYDLRQALNGLSADLEQTYHEALERMKRRLKPPQHKVLQRILLWVVWVERPLSVAELEHATAVRPGVNEIDPESILPIRQITTWSAGLIFVDQKSLVRLIHTTTESFFSQHREELFPSGDGIIAHA